MRTLDEARVVWVLTFGNGGWALSPDLGTDARRNETIEGGAMGHLARHLVNLGATFGSKRGVASGLRGSLDLEA